MKKSIMPRIYLKNMELSQGLFILRLVFHCIRGSSHLQKDYSRGSGYKLGLANFY